jgi:hypothetical protein
LLIGREPLVGVAVIWLGAAVVGTAVALLASWHVLGYTTVIAGGIAVVGSGVVWHADRSALIVVEVIVSGIATIGFGIVEIGPSVVVSSVRRAIDSATKAPDADGKQKSS